MAFRDDVERLWRDERFDLMAPHDRRLHRAQVIAAQIMRLADPHLCEHGERNSHKAFYEELVKFLWNSGFEILTDADRADAGLPIRGRNGWTADELRALENARLDAMMRPMPITPTKL